MNDILTTIDNYIRAANADKQRIDKDVLAMKARREAIEEKGVELEDIRAAILAAQGATTPPASPTDDDMRTP